MNKLNSLTRRIAIYALAAAPIAALLIPALAETFSTVETTGPEGAHFKGTLNTGATAPATMGANVPRLFWFPKKAALRAGVTTGSQWDELNIGQYSLAVGSNVLATQSGNVALGTATSATGYSAAVAMGTMTVASGNSSFAAGSGSQATGGTSVAMGHTCYARGFASTAIGSYSDAPGLYATAIGASVNATPCNSFVVGRYNAIEGTAGTWVNSEPLFVVGNGAPLTYTQPEVRKNAFVVSKNGDAGVQGVLRVWPAGDISMGDFQTGTKPPAK